MKISFKKLKTNIRRETEESNSDYSYYPEYLETDNTKESDKNIRMDERKKYQIFKRFPSSENKIEFKPDNIIYDYKNKNNINISRNKKKLEETQFSFGKTFFRQSTDSNKKKVNFNMTKNFDYEKNIENEELEDHEELIKKRFKGPFSGSDMAFIKRRLNNSLSGLHNNKKTNKKVNLNKSVSIIEKIPFNKLKTKIGDFSMNNSNQAISFCENIGGKVIDKSKNDKNRITNISFELNSSFGKKSDIQNIKRLGTKNRPTIKSTLQESFSIEHGVIQKENLVINKINAKLIEKIQKNKKDTQELYKFNIFYPDQKGEIKQDANISGISIGRETMHNTSNNLQSNSISPKKSLNGSSNQSNNKTLTFNKQTLNFSNNLLNESASQVQPEASYIEDLHFQFVKMMIQMKNLVSNIENKNLSKIDELDYNTVVPIDEIDLE